jgi:hypothetical protein
MTSLEVINVPMHEERLKAIPRDAGQLTEGRVVNPPG